MTDQSRITHALAAAAATTFVKTALDAGLNWTDIAIGVETILVIGVAAAAEMSGCPDHERFAQEMLETMTERAQAASRPIFEAFPMPDNDQAGIAAHHRLNQEDAPVRKMEPIDRCRELLADGLRLAERGASKLRLLDPAGRYADQELYEAWDALQAAAKCVDEARRERSRAARSAGDELP
jgi:hypothetical protein